MNYGEPLQVRLPTCVARVVKFEVSYWRMGGSTHGMMPRYDGLGQLRLVVAGFEKTTVFGVSHV